jgi:ABC-type multidrug transport system fused ATPase/permease subunit
VVSWLRLYHLIRAYRARVVLASCLVASACLLTLIGPILVERLLRRADQGAALATLAGAALLVVLAAVVQPLAAGSNAWLLGSVAIRVARDLRRQLYERLQRLPLAWFDRTPAGTVMSRLTEDVAVIQSLAGGQALAVLVDLATAAAAALWMATHSLPLAAVLLGLMLLYSVIFRRYAARIHEAAHDVRTQLDRLFCHLKDRLDGALVVRATAGEAREVAEFTRQFTALHEPRLLAARIQIDFQSLSLGIAAMGASLVFAIGSWQVLAGRLTGTELIVATALTALVFGPLSRLSELVTLFQQAAASLSRVGEILDYPLPAALAPATTSHSPLAGRVEFQRVSFAYLPDQPVLHDISLVIEPGTKVAIVGKSGSGKTTLVNLLLRFYEPTGGEICLDGRPLGEFSDEQLRRDLAVVSQEPVVFRATLADNLRYGVPEATPAEIEAAARGALVDQFADQLPRKYETIVGEGGHPLSQGQRQRIAIARLLCRDPSVVILDEATSSLDRASELLLQGALARLLAGRTTITIAHRLQTVQTADLIVVMDQGRIVQTGMHAQLLDDGEGVYSRLCHGLMLPAAGSLAAVHPRRPAAADLPESLSA